MLLKEEKNERLSIKFDPRVQVNVAGSCSKYYFIGIIHPFLWSAISNHTLVDKCSLVMFNILCPGPAKRTIVGLGCVWRRAPLLTALGQWLPQAACAMVPVCFPRRPNSPVAAAPPPNQRADLSVPNTRTGTTQPGEGEPVHISYSAGVSWAASLLPVEPSRRRLRHGTALSSLCSHRLPAPSLEGEKLGQLLPQAARQPLYCHINAINCWSRATETSS